MEATAVLAVVGAKALDFVLGYVCNKCAAVPVHLGTFKNHDVPRVLRTVWKDALKQAIKQYLEGDGQRLSSGHREAIESVVDSLGAASMANALFVESDAPLGDFQSNPLNATRNEALAESQSLCEAFLRERVPPLGPTHRTLPDGFYRSVGAAIPHLLAFFFLERAIKRDDRARAQIMWEAAQAADGKLDAILSQFVEFRNGIPTLIEAVAQRTGEVVRQEMQTCVAQINLDALAENQRLKEELELYRAQGLARVTREARAGDPQAVQALADARDRKDLAGVQALLIAEASIRQPDVERTVREQVERIREIVAIAADRGDWPTVEAWVDKGIALAQNEMLFVGIAGDLAVARGDLARARTLFIRWRDFWLARKTELPTDNEAMRSYSLALERLGDVQLALGDVHAAMVSHKESLVIAEVLLERDPFNAHWQRDLIVSKVKMAEMHRVEGDLCRALSLCDDATNAARASAARHHDNVHRKRDLAACLLKRGEVMAALGNIAGALASFREGLKLSDELAALDPANTEWQSDLAACHNKIGDVLASQGDSKGALASYREDLKISRALAARDSANTEWQRGLAVSHYKLGVWFTNSGDNEKARQEFLAGRAIMVALVGRDPHNAKWATNLAAFDRNLARLDDKAM